jgi:hypothetical protein
MPQRGADPRRHREHCGNARNDRDVELAPRRRAGLDLGAHGRRHGEYTGIAAGHHGDIRTIGRVP